jgi:NTP pyrophosphatase (non-canonical NTP hydrolase)
MDTILLKANNKWTLDQRMRKLQEELLELSLEIHHYLDGRGELEKVEEETADVIITLRSVELYLGEESSLRVQAWCDRKLARMDKRYF